MIKKNMKTLSLILIVLAIIFPSLLLIKDAPSFVDEDAHCETIKEIATNRITRETFSRNAQLPGYYFIMAGLRFLLGVSSLAELRILTTIFSLLSILAFFLVAQKINKKEIYVKTLQYFFFPILFIFFFLVYNDVTSLLLVLLSFYFVLKKRYQTAGLTGFLSILIRQNNIIWLGFFCLYIFLEEYKFRFSRKSLVGFLKDIPVFIFSLVYVIIFVIVNGNPAMAEPDLNPMAFHFENVFFILFLHFFLFLPLNLNNLPKIIRMIKRKLYVLPIIIGIFIFYFLSFKVKHWYNDPSFHGFLRNRLVNWGVANQSQKVIFFIPIAYSILCLGVTKFSKKSYYLLYPFTILFLSLSWMIEQRYYLIPFTFFILFKKQKSRLLEYATIVIYVILTVWIFWGVLNRKFFL